MNGLTHKQAQCLATIKRLTVDGVPPTYAEIAADLRLASKSGVHRLISGLVERGAVWIGPGRNRVLQVVEPGNPPPRRIPTAEDIAALSDADFAALGRLVDSDYYRRSVAAGQRRADAILARGGAARP